MILRVLRARAVDPALTAQALVAETLAAAYAAPGLLSFQAGFRRDERAEASFTLITTWVDFDALIRTLGADPTRPAWLAAVPHLDATADHYELVGTPLVGIVPFDGSVVRILRGRLHPHEAASYFEQTRERRERLLDSGDIVLSHLGRRMVGRHEEAVVVSVWRDQEAVTRVAGGPDRPVLAAEVDRYFESWRLETYTASPDGSTAPTRGCPAIVLADDERRYRYATPSAADLHGEPIARLLGRRIDEQVPPERIAGLPDAWDQFLRAGREHEGVGEMRRADGSRLAVAFRARPHYPWAGSHTFVMAPVAEGDETGAPDLEASVRACSIVGA